MVSFEYVVVPAPQKAPKIKGAKTGAARFAMALSELMNAYGAEGWEYVRADTLPCEEKVGFMRTSTVTHNVLVFRRVIEEEEDVAVAPPQKVRAMPTDRAESEPLARFTAALRPDSAPKAPAPRLGAAGVEGPGPTPRLGPADEPGPVTTRPKEQ